jgi:heme A synthase
MPTPLLADISNLPWVAIIAVAGSMLLTIVIIIGGLIIAHHRQKLWHDTARLALEKGQPLPAAPDLPAQPRPRADEPSRDLRAGLILLATGAGLFVFFDALLGRWMAYVGAIPGFIGVALMLHAILSLLLKGKGTPPTDQP